MIKNSHFCNALCDLETSCNIISYPVYKKLGFGELKPTKYLLQFANGALESTGVVEEVWLELTNFYS